MVWCSVVRFGDVVLRGVVWVCKGEGGGCTTSNCTESMYVMVSMDEARWGWAGRGNC